MSLAGLAGTVVLIIDDEEDFARTLASRLELRGMVVRFAGGGEEGLRAMAESLPDVLLLDMRMPGMSGVEVLRRLRREELGGEAARLPVLIVSGHAAEDDFLEADALGIQGYIAKPLQFDELLAAIAGVRHKE